MALGKKSSYDSMWPEYVSVAKRRALSLSHLKALEKKGQKTNPIVIEGRIIAKTFWGKAWCESIERYSDYESRLPRGRTYVRNGSVIDLQITKGLVKAQVMGSSLYQVTINVKPVPNEKWTSLIKSCSGKIDSLIELLQGKFSKGVMEIITQDEGGLFPKKTEISMKCSCPDSAGMCKHIAAALYGIGASLDTKPEWLFALRHVDHLDLIRSIVYKMDSSGGIQTIGGKQQQPSQGMDRRFANMTKAKSVCLVHQLGLLVIPQAKKIKLESMEGITYTLIAEKQLPNLPDDSVQETLYHTCSEKLNKTLSQLAIFVSKTGFNDVAHRNIPILDPQLAEDHKKVGLIDLEHMESINGGFFGDWNGSCGLIGCTSSEMQVDSIIAMARAQGLNITEQKAKQTKQNRLEKIEEAIDLPRFYARKGITGSELLFVDIASLDLADETTAFKIPSTIRAEAILGGTGMIKLSDLAQKVVEEINKLITLNAKDSELAAASVKYKRFILLNTNDAPWSLYNHLGYRNDIPFSCTNEQAEEAQRSLWLDKIIRALAEKGHLFKLTKVNSNGYFIQA